MITRWKSSSQPKRGFVSAPYGLPLGALPELLAERSVAWEWAKDSSGSRSNSSSAIAEADIFIGVLNRSAFDYAVLYEIGIAAGLRKPILLIMTPRRTLPIDLRAFSVVRVSLSNRRALAFHLDAFLTAPARSIFDNPASSISPAPEPPGMTSSQVMWKNTPESELERQVFELVERSGGSALAQPEVESGGRYKPDLLVWLGSHDPELLDPAVIEVKAQVEPAAIRSTEHQLASFMGATGVRTGIVITSGPIPERAWQNWPNIFWLDLATFKELVESSRLGPYLREARNRAAHGVV